MSYCLQVIMPANPGHALAILGKVFVDQTINSPLGTVTFFAWSRAMKGQPDRAVKDVTEKLWPTTLASWRLWPVAQAVNFMMVPAQFRIIFINIVAVAWTCILSTTVN
jgi:Mpv17 / PMP22 family